MRSASAGEPCVEAVTWGAAAGWLAPGAAAWVAAAPGGEIAPVELEVWQD
jgi:hypothetical protein